MSAAEKMAEFSLPAQQPANTFAIGCVRVSTEFQNERFGPERQRADIERQAQRENLPIVHWVEETISGADVDRAAQNTYYDLARKHPGLNFIFAHPTRVGRWVEVTVGIARTLVRQLGAGVYITGLGDLRDRRNWKYFVRDAAEGDADYENIIYNLSDGKFRKALRNEWPQGRQPYGYTLLRNDRGKSTTLTPNESTAPVYQRMVDQALGGMGAYSISKQLNAESIPVPRDYGKGRKHAGWSDVQVLRILRNPAYMGSLVYVGPEGDIATVTFPALIDAPRWQELQQLITDRRKHRPSRSKLPNLLGGHVRCAICNHTLVINRSRNRKGVAQWGHYACRGATKATLDLARGLAPCTHTTRHRVRDLDEACWTYFVRHMSDPAFLARQRAKGQPKPPDHTERLTQLQEQISGAFARAVRLGIDDDTLSAAIQPWQEEAARLKAEMQAPVVELPSQDLHELSAALAANLEPITELLERREILELWQAVFTIGPDDIKDLSISLSRL